MATRVRINRRVSGAAGAPVSLLSAELAYNMADGIIYVGKGDNGSGVATSVVAIAKDDFTYNIPSSGTTGHFLQKTAGGVEWAAVAAGTNYVEGNGIDITGSTISVDSLTIPSIDAGKIGSGTFNTARIPGIDAAKIISGTIDIARLPVLPGTVQIVSSGGIAALTAPQQAEIGDGSVVTTTDGRRWIYTGSGSKTAEASYIEMGDITPEWSIIANKPTFATVATSGAYTDLSGRPTLGTMASQNANAVAITGGTIDGVTIDGGTF